MNTSTAEPKEKRRQVERALRLVSLPLGVAFLLAALCVGWNCLRNPAVNGWHLAEDLLSALLFLLFGILFILRDKPA